MAAASGRIFFAACGVGLVALFAISTYPNLYRSLSLSKGTVTATAPHLASVFLDKDWKVKDEKKDEVVLVATDVKETAKTTDDYFLFQKSAQLAYDEATAPVNLKRQKFNLTNWTKQTSGGLRDPDRLLLGDIYYKAQSVFEFGLGESTYIAAEVGVPRYAGVDSDPNWVAMAREKSNMGHFRFYLADIGETKAWGVPVQDLKKNVYNYQLSALSSEAKPFDVYLVDGRYRVACAAACFLHAASRGANMSNVQVGVHDQDHLSRGYHAALTTIADKSLGSPKLFIYQLRNTTTIRDVYRLWERYRTIHK